MTDGYILKDGFVIDGTGKEAVLRKADIAVKNDRIAASGDLGDTCGYTIINVKGLAVCPGFIDAHSHSDFTLLADGRAEAKIFQGITTEINGNCGLSAAPLYGPAFEQREKEIKELGIKERWRTFQEYFSLLEKRGWAVNFATLAGHGNLRASAAGYADKKLSDSEKSSMKELLGEALKAGAKGVSTGLIYPPGIFADTRELVEIACEAVKYNGIYTTHMRSEGDRLLESVEEVIRIAAESGIHAHISHLKTSGEKNWGKLEKVFAKIDNALNSGLSLTCDRYPYIASSTDLDALLPSWAFEGGRKGELKRLESSQDKLADDFFSEHPEASSATFWDTIFISSVDTEKNKWTEGKSVSEISGINKMTPMKCVFDLLLEEDLRVGAIFFFMNEKNLESILKKPYTVIGTDSSARSFDGVTAQGRPHPRGFGSMPRVLGRYARERNVLTLNGAVYKMTGLPAKIFRLQQRGIIRDGFFADITVFDPEQINDTSSFDEPFKKQTGIHHVFVNGTPVVLDGESTGALPGRVLE